jgi:hypothetical protein
MSTDKSNAVPPANEESKADAPEMRQSADAPDEPSPTSMPREVNGPKGPEPTRYGDWEQKGRCSDF